MPSASMKRSGYLRHKLAFVNEEVRQKTVVFRKIDGDLNPSDVFTKYLAFAAWKKHTEFNLNHKLNKREVE